MTPKQAWTEGYRAQTKGAKVFDNPETGRNRCQWYEGYATAERETFILGDNPFHPESPEGRAWDQGDRSSIG